MASPCRFTFGLGFLCEKSEAEEVALFMHELGFYFQTSSTVSGLTKGIGCKMLQYNKLHLEGPFHIQAEGTWQKVKSWLLPIVNVGTCKHAMHYWPCGICTLHNMHVLQEAEHAHWVLTLFLQAAHATSVPCSMLVEGVCGCKPEVTAAFQHESPGTSSCWLRLSHSLGCSIPREKEPACVQSVNHARCLLALSEGFQDEPQVSSCAIFSGSSASFWKVLLLECGIILFDGCFLNEAQFIGRSGVCDIHFVAPSVA